MPCDEIRLRPMGKTSVALISLLCLLVPNMGHAQNAAQGHILDAGINLGWAVGIIESSGGVSAASVTEIGEDYVLGLAQTDDRSEVRLFELQR